MKIGNGNKKHFHKPNRYFQNFSGSYMSFSFSWERHSSFRSSSLLLTSYIRKKLIPMQNEIKAGKMWEKFKHTNAHYNQNIIHSKQETVIKPWLHLETWLTSPASSFAPQLIHVCILPENNQVNLSIFINKVKM